MDEDRNRNSKLGLEEAEAAIELPLGCGLFAGVEKGLAGRGGILLSEGLVFAGSGRSGECIRRRPQTFSGEKVMFHACAGNLLEVPVAQAIVERGADIFVRDLDAADTFIVGG